MSFQYGTQRGGKPTATSITASQRSACTVVFYRFSQTDITKIETLNVATDKSLAGGGARSNQGNLKTKERLIIRNDVVRCNFSKNKGSSSGSFSLTLKRGKEVKNGEVQPNDIDYLKAIHPGDWVMIYVKKSGTIDIDSIKPDSGLKFLGVVENVRYLEIDDPNRAAPRLEYVVTGRDFGKVFENEIFFNPAVNNETIQTLLGAKFLTDGKNTIRGDNRASVGGYTPDRVIKNLVSFYLGGSFDSLNANNEVWYVPALLGRAFRPAAKIKNGGVSFVDILSTGKIGVHNHDRNNNFITAVPMPGAALIKSLPASGTVWGVLQFMQNAALNEMFTELSRDKSGNLQPTLVCRQMPFSNLAGNETNVFAANARSPAQGGKGTIINDRISEREKTYFVNLPKTTINSSKIKQKNVGKSEHERVNHVIVVPKVDSETYDVLYSAAFNVPSVQRYGLRSLQTQTSYILNPGEGIKNYLSRCVNLLMDWFFLSHQLFNGTVVIDGLNEHVELGTNLYIEDVKQLYHVEGYTHTYEIQDDSRIVYNIEFRVSRGQVFDFGTRKANFIGPSSANKEPTTITTSVLEGIKD